MPREISDAELVKWAKKLLDNPLNLGLVSDKPYTRIHDDHDGTFEGGITVVIDRMGDVFIETSKPHGLAPLRFRNFFGGGQSLRVYNALRLLALAIELDNKDHPQR